MKIDLARLPVAEGVVAFLVAVLAITFIAAFGDTHGGEGKAGPSASASPAPSPGGSPSPGGGAVVIDMTDNAFDKTDITLPANQPATFDITNKGAAVHNLHIGGADGKYAESFCKKGGAEPCSDPNVVPGGSTATLQWTPASPGTYVFRCDFHPDPMKGTITVK